MVRCWNRWGVRPVEEAVYRALLARTAAAPAELTGPSGQPEPDVAASLAALEELGLVTRVPGARGRFRAVRPDVAVDVLAARRREELTRAQAAARELVAVMPAEERHRPEDIVEVVAGRDAIAARFEQLLAATREELLVLDRPPYVADAARSESSVRDLLRDEVVVRGIYAPEALELPGALEAAQDAVRAGERSRVHPGLPMKLAISDRRLALLPIDADDAVDAALCIRPSALLDALVQLFDLMWEQALPITAPPEEGVVSNRDLAALLASGAKDDVVARHLGTSNRTLSRRIAEMMDALHVRTRFQAGVQAVHRGWLPASADGEGVDHHLLERRAPGVGRVQPE
ncbi:helix-turn-helix domain-containing protein [Nocardioides sp. TF02-7]|uniref:helix-turn-helix domain-containing protein n=1 Tax=Nocardioides sp. TF02-7 TaxID=2917724 RepID=UPI001F069534|nr:helix-turn-helix domain-containing protein [Nocardioides sp. TF02-7]UMG93791.1 transcriptional regulator TrmB [Nocardioides sp. TF02-7]